MVTTMRGIQAFRLCPELIPSERRLCLLGRNSGSTRAGAVARFFCLVTAALLCLLEPAPTSALNTASAERGVAPVKVHASADFGPDAEFQNMAVTSLPDGRMLVSNTSAMVLFDGARWRTFRHPRGLATLWEIVPTPDGRFYAGFAGEIGWFEPDGMGGYRWQSAMDRLPPEARDFGTIWSAKLGREGVWFSAGDQTMLLRPDGSAKVFPTVRFGVFLFRIGDEIWLNDRGAGLLRAVQNGDDITLQPVPGGETINDMPILGVTALAPDDVLIANAEGELYRLTRGVMTPFAKDLWPELAKNLPQTLTTLADGNIAIGFMRAGPWVFNRNGKVLERYGDAQGVPPLTTFAIHEDAVGSLWVAQNQGVVQISRGLGVSRFDRLSGIPDASTLVRHQGHLFAGGLAGLYRLIPSDGVQPAHFVLVENGPRNVWQMASVGDWLWIAGSALQRYRVQADGRLGMPERLVSTQFGKSVQLSRFHPDRLYFSGTDGFAVIDQASSAQPQVRNVPLDGSPVLLAEANADEVWVGDQNSMFWRLRADGDEWKAQSFDSSAGVPGGEAYVVPGSRGPWFLTASGALSFDATNERFVPSRDWPAAAPAQRLEGFFEDAEQALWIRGEGRTGVVFKNDPTRFVDAMFQSSDDRSQVVGFMREGEVLWVARSDGVQRIELNLARPSAVAMPRVTELIDSRSGSRLPLAADTLRIDDRQRDLNFAYALPTPVRSEAVSFRSRLVGNDSEWSEWTSATGRSYTNLPDGALRFELEARDVFGQTSSAAPLLIEAQAPWYRSRWAQIGYVLAALGLMLLLSELVSRRRQRALLARQRELEATVAERTHELADKNLALQDQAARLLEIDSLKSRFFTNVSHEFRTPLTLVLGPLDDVLADTRTRLSERTREQLELANRNARRVLDLLVELLDVNRLEHGALPMKCVRAELSSLVRRQAEALAPLFERHGHSLEVRVPEAAVMADVDVVQLERCVSNLLSNAAKYTPRGGSIVVELEAQQTRARLTVRDNGRGIAVDALPHVFDRFFQAESANGVGIGLALVREIIEGHGGKVGAESELGLGSTFWLELPLATADAALPAPTNVAVHAAPTEQPDRPVTVSELPLALVIDDHDDLRMRVRQLLEARFRVIEAHDGPSGFSAARDELPDVIVCDVMMPGFDGVELARRLRANADTRAIPLLLLTAKAGAEFAVTGLAAGADDYLSKPFDSAELLARIDALISMRRRLQFQMQREAVTLTPITASADERWREKLDAAIDANLSDPAFSVDSLAETMHTDRSNVFRKLKAQTGMGPSEYLREARLLRAHALLEAQSGNISEVAYAVGFESLSSFSRAFKQRYGFAPSEVLRRKSA
jgi:signal transduction histidine kinase/DNA-binding response OmpR family regulator